MTNTIINKIMAEAAAGKFKINGRFDNKAFVKAYIDASNRRLSMTSMSANDLEDLTEGKITGIPDNIIYYLPSSIEDFNSSLNEDCQRLLIFQIIQSEAAIEFEKDSSLLEESAISDYFANGDGEDLEVTPALAIIPEYDSTAWDDIENAPLPAVVATTTTVIPTPVIPTPVNIRIKIDPQGEGLRIAKMAEKTDKLAAEKALADKMQELMPVKKALALAISEIKSNLDCYLTRSGQAKLFAMAEDLVKRVKSMSGKDLTIKSFRGGYKLLEPLTGKWSFDHTQKWVELRELAVSRATAPALWYFSVVVPHESLKGYLNSQLVELLKGKIEISTADDFTFWVSNETFKGKISNGDLDWFNGIYDSKADSILKYEIKTVKSADELPEFNSLTNNRIVWTAKK